MEMKGFTGMFLFSSWWLWGVLFFIGSLWYVCEPLVDLYQLLKHRTERDTDPLFDVVEKLEREERIE